MSLLKRLSSSQSKKITTADGHNDGNAVAVAHLGSRFDALLFEDEEILVAVVGVTGSGKSTFIKRVTGRNDIEIGEGLCSMTQAVKEYHHTVSGRKFRLIDTPGFDDTEVDDEDIFEALVDWLEKSYRKGQRLTGLLYLHRIISNRAKGSDLRNLRVFQKLCGDKSFSNVIIGITWWDHEDPAVVVSREEILKGNDEFWGGMTKKGAQVIRIPRDQRGCINLLMTLSTHQATTLAVQDELVNQGKKPTETDAATALVRYDKTRAARDSDWLDQMASDLLAKAQQLGQEQRAARTLVEQRTNSEEEEERLLAEAEAQLEQKKRAEARKRRMEEIQRQLKELEKGSADSHQESSPGSNEAASQAKHQPSLPRPEPQPQITPRAEPSQERALIATRGRLHKASLQSAMINLATYSRTPASPFMHRQSWRGGRTRTVGNMHVVGPLQYGFCDFCMASIPCAEGYWSCKQCILGDGHLAICNECKVTRPIACFDASHTLKFESWSRSFQYGPFSTCRRLRQRRLYRRLSCSACRQSLGPLYLHCCACDNDDFDMCIGCWNRLIFCRQPAHTLYLHAWTPPNERLLLSS